jgi:hypothetical protein
MMVVRVRIRWEGIRWFSGAPRGVLVSAFGRGLNWASVVALLAAFWRLGNDLDWTQRFVVSQGLFSHWQLWLALAILLQVAAAILQRYSRDGGGAAMP